MEYSIYFSPTGTTRRITDAITKGLGADDHITWNLTSPDADESLKLDSRDTVVIGMPVYGGRLPALALSRMESIQGHGAKAVIAVVYGNRDYEDALLELKDVMTAKGFLVVAAGAFIGEHSFSTGAFPIAEHRPHGEDLRMAEDFGLQAGNLIRKGISETRTLSVPGSFPYKERGPQMNLSPETNEALCTRCMRCIGACPTGAIDDRNPLSTDKSLCILCAACIKICGFSARAIEDERLLQKAQQLFKGCGEPKAPEVFFPV